MTDRPMKTMKKFGNDPFANGVVKQIKFSIKQKCNNT